MALLSESSCAYSFSNTCFCITQGVVSNNYIRSICVLNQMSKMADWQFDRFVPKRYSRCLAFLFVPGIDEQLWMTITSL